jgi:uncharacterized protein DUF3738
MLKNSHTIPNLSNKMLWGACLSDNAHAWEMALPACLEKQAPIYPEDSFLRLEMYEIIRNRCAEAIIVRCGGAVKTLTVMLLVGLCLATEASPAQKPSFDVVSIKPNRLGGPPRRIGTEGNRFIAENAPLIILIQFAYGSGTSRLAREHLIGGPSWINTDRFDIETRADISTRSIPTERTWLMVQALLEDRFQLRVHRVLCQTSRRGDRTRFCRTA